MNTGQTMLTIGALTLLSVIILRINNTFLTTNSVVQESKFNVLAVSLATSLIETANRKSFDAATDGNPIDDLSLLTSAAGMGHAPGETFSAFNDFDDFNGYDSTVTNLPSANFDIHCDVFYVNPPNLEVKVNYPTWYKRINVRVTNDAYNNLGTKDTLKLSSIYSYWYFR